MGHVGLKEMGAQVRLVITDMDGTLLNSKKEITDRTRNAVRGLREKGIDFTICTGRIPTMIDYYTKELDIRVPVVSANGAVIWDPVKRQPLYGKEIPANTAQTLMDFLESHHMDYSALTLENSYFSTNSIRIEKFNSYNKIAKANGLLPMKLDRLTDGHGFLEKHKIYKLLVYEKEEGRYAEAGAFIKGFTDIYATCSDAGLWDISATGVSKGTGLLHVRNLMEIDKTQVCAFGDYDNDVPMLREAGFSVAMENGCDALKSCAVYVTGSNDEDGVARVIEQFLL